MKRAIIIILFIAVSLLAISHHKVQQERSGQQLITAAYEGDLIAVKDLLDQGAPLEYALYFNDPVRHYQEMDFNLLQAAASSGNEKLLSYVIEKQLPLDAVNHKNWTALYVAVRDGHGESAARLIQAGADVNIPTDTGSTPLIMSILADFPSSQERYMLVEYMLKRNANPNLKTIWGTDALFYAVTELKDPQIVQLLLDYQADICQTDLEGKNLLQLAPKSLTSLLRKRYNAKCKTPSPVK